MKRVIITGCSGMIGSALLRLFVRKKIKVYAIIRPYSKRRNNVPDSPYIQIIECDISKLLDLKTQIKEKCDAFFHLAWQGTFGDSRNDMYLQNKNIRYTIDAVTLANCLGCSVFLGAGSQAEYGRVEGKLSYDTPVNPENGYGMAKLCAGQMSKVLCEKYGIKHIWARILSIYGPFDGEHTMVMTGIYKMLSGEIPSFTKAEQVWDYLYCDDAAKALYLAAEKGKNGSVYCIGSGVAKPLVDYITCIRDIVAPERDIDFGAIPYNEKQVMYLCADIENLQRDTGFVPEISFDEGIKKTVKWIKEGEIK